MNRTQLPPSLHIYIRLLVTPIDNEEPVSSIGLLQLISKRMVSWFGVVGGGERANEVEVLSFGPVSGWEATAELSRKGQDQRRSTQSHQGSQDLPLAPHALPTAISTPPKAAREAVIRCRKESEPFFLTALPLDNDTPINDVRYRMTILDSSPELLWLGGVPSSLAGVVWSRAVGA